MHTITSKQNAILWAQEVTQNPSNLRILDTETTGLHDGEICSIAVIDGTGNAILDCLVKPKRGIPADAAAIHGITDEDVEDAPGWELIAPRVADILKGCTVVVYNAVYDRKMMHRSAEYAGIEKIDWKTFSTWHCAMEQYAAFFGDWNDYHGNFRWQRLTSAARHCGVPDLDAHSALGDCRMTLGVVLHMASQAT